MPDYNYITETGVIIVDTSQTLEEVQEEYKIAFNDAELVVDSGDLSVLINSEAEQRDAVARNNATLANQINPNEAGGMFLDSIMALTDTERDTGERTTVTATLGGSNGTLVPQGSAAESDEGDRFISTGDATIGVGGTVEIQFQASEFGPIALGAGELTKILDSVLGWETIDNGSAGKIGRFEQSDAGAANVRRDTLALQGISLSEAVFSNVRAVDNVSSLSFRENIYDVEKIIDGLTMPPNSVYVCVDGGLDEEIAQALLRAKTGGAQWHNGESGSPVSVDIIDPISGQEYTILFDRPTNIPMEAEFTVSSNSTDGDTVQKVKDAVILYANGQIAGEDGFIVGGDVSPFELAGAVTVTSPEILVRQVLVTTVVAANPQPVTINIGLFEKASISEDDIAVTVI